MGRTKDESTITVGAVMSSPEPMANGGSAESDGEAYRLVVRVLEVEVEVLLAPGGVWLKDSLYDGYQCHI